MKPIFFEPVYKDVIWGGDNIQRIFKRNIQGDSIGESWEVSAHPNGLSKILNEDIEKENLLELFNDKLHRKNIFGNHCMELDKFPILIKFIDASKNLSIQVHPNNAYAKLHENDSGKNEVWYVMECKENSKIVYGFKETVTKENLKHILDNDIEKNVNFVNVRKGDFISIPAGTIHAIGEGIVLCEVQQSSDVTYRVYDWNRLDKNGKPRKLHKEKALDVINLDIKTQIHNYENIKSGSINIYKDVFSIDMIKIDNYLDGKSDEDSFFGFVVLEGNGKIESSKFSKDIDKGSVFLIPASLGEFKISGNLKIMKVYV